MVSADFTLSGKVALVVGDSEYWCRYTAAALADAGADVALAARGEDKINAAAAEVRDKGTKALAVVANTSDAADVEKAIGRVVDELGKIDILVNAANLEFAKPFLETTEQDMRRLLDVNLMSAFHCSQAVGKRMIAQGKGRIINLVSCLAERGVENLAAYCASMGGILQLTRALDIEWAGKGITSNAIGYGWMSEVGNVGGAQEELLLKYLPLRRYSHPAEVGPLLVYLSSDTTDFLSGQFLYVDGAVMSHL